MARVDCLVVGGGPAGLAAALYLARFRRTVALVDGGQSRASLIPLARNYPGFPDGVTGPDLLSRMREQARAFGVIPVHSEITTIMRDDGGFHGRGAARTVSGRVLLLATGVIDVKPDLPDLAALVDGGHLRFCPVCDGHDVIDRPVTVVGDLSRAADEALFLRTFTGQLTVLPLDPPPAWSADVLRSLATAGIAVEQRQLRQLCQTGDRIVAHFASGEASDVGILYPAMGLRPRTVLASQLGIAPASGGCIETDAHQETSVRGVFAAGDVVNELHQISVAVGHAAIAATAIHNRLRQAPGG